jgi:hypothetical protein
MVCVGFLLNPKMNSNYLGNYLILESSNSSDHYDIDQSRGKEGTIIVVL